MKSQKFVGRKLELQQLASAWRSQDPELIAVYGRRRVGKTELIRYGRPKNAFFIEFTGQKGAALRTQLLNFSNSISKAIGLKVALPNNWTGAFSVLETIIQKHVSALGPVILFFDEAPWLDGRRSGFLTAFEYFWNHFASQNPKVKLVLCGSSAAWVIKKIVSGKGGWHRRVTQKLHVKPFTLSETRDFLQSRNIRFALRDIVRLYAVLGGIPYYLKFIQPGEAIETLVQRLLFQKGAPLEDEFQELFKSLFDNAKDHQAIVKVLATRRCGYTRSEIAELTGIQSGGGLSSYLENLLHSDFISVYHPLGVSSEKHAHYRLSDPLSLFYLKWLGRSKSSWESIVVSQSYKSWMGYAFEIIAWNHDELLCDYLGLKRIPWTSTKANLEEEGEVADIDLLIDVPGGSLYLIEMKFYSERYQITKTEANHIENRRRVVARHFNGRRSVITCLLAPQGVYESELLSTTIDKVFPNDVLFT